jgi:hypothetical protein
MVVLSLAKKMPAQTFKFFHLVLQMIGIPLTRRRVNLHLLVRCRMIRHNLRRNAEWLYFHLQKKCLHKLLNFFLKNKKNLNYFYEKKIL